MSSTAVRSEGMLPELEDELELEEEFELAGRPAGEEEEERFLSGMAKRAIRAALGQVAGPLGAGISESEYELEGEFEFEEEYEGEGMANPLRRVYPDAMMAHLAHSAAETESEAEAEAFIGALLPVASALFKRAAPALLKAAPSIARGLGRITQALRGNEVTRGLVDALPTVVKQTAGQLANQYANGQPITAQGALRTLAGNAGKVLTSPQQRAQACHRTQVLDRRHHAQHHAHLAQQAAQLAQHSAQLAQQGAAGEAIMHPRGRTRSTRRAMPARRVRRGYGTGGYGGGYGGGYPRRRRGYPGYGGYPVPVGVPTYGVDDDFGDDAGDDLGYGE
jgi:hypothetical protein